jgi:putative peptidoglycan lipid II flippase
VLGFVIQGQLEGLLQRLFAGGIADLGCLALAVALLTPSIVNGLFRQLRRSFRLRGELG